MAANFLFKVSYAIGDVNWPQLGLERGVPNARYAVAKGAAQFGWAMLCMLCAPAVERIGTKNILLCALVLHGVECLLVTLTSDALPPALFLALVIGDTLCTIIALIGYLALGMQLCASSLAAATQFAAMMAVANLGSTVGDLIVAARVCEDTRGYFTLMGGLVALGVPLAMALPSRTAAQPGKSHDEAQLL